MSSRSFNAQFVTTDFRLLDDPRYCAFMRSASFATYMVLRRYVWRGARHPIAKVEELFRDGFLVTAIPRQVLAEKLGIGGLPSVTRHIAELEELGVIRRVTTGRVNVYVLGTWEDRSAAADGRYVVETFFQDELFGPEPFDPPRMDDLPPGLGRRRPPEVLQTRTPEVSQTHTSEVSQTRTPEVSRMKPLNKEINREAKRPPRPGWRSPFEPIDDRERPDDVLRVEL